MRSLFKYIFFAVGVFAGVLVFRSWFLPSTSLAANTKFSRVIAEKVSPQKLQEVTEYVAQSQANTEPDICRASREKILTSKIEDIVRDISDRRTQLDNNCLFYDLMVTDAVLATAMYNSCRREKFTSGGGDPKVECWQALTFFKANLVTKAFGDRSLSEADAETLIYLFMSKMADGKYRTAGEIAALNSITDQLIEEMPDSFSARKAAAIPRVVADFENMSKGADLNPEADAYVAEALRFNPGDPEMQEVATLREIYTPGEKLSVEKAVAHAERTPQSSLAQYFLAGAFENAGRHEEAIAAARRAHDMEPSNSRYRETLQKLVRGEKNAFTVQLGVGFDNL